MRYPARVFATQQGFALPSKGLRYPARAPPLDTRVAPSHIFSSLVMVPSRGVNEKGAKLDFSLAFLA